VSQKLDRNAQGFIIFEVCGVVSDLLTVHFHVVPFCRLVTNSVVPTRCWGEQL
jgi:hypothetical protein